MHAMRFLRLARRVIHIESREKAKPPARSLMFVLSCGLGGWESCGCDCGSDDAAGGGAVACACDVADGGWFDWAFSCGFAVVVESGWELVPQPK